MFNDLPEEVIVGVIDTIRRVGLTDPEKAARDIFHDDVLKFMRRCGHPLDDKGVARIEEDAVRMVRKTRYEAYREVLRHPTPEEAAKVAEGVRERVAKQLAGKPGILTASEILAVFTTALRVECVKRGIVPPYRAELRPEHFDGMDPDSWIALKAKEMVSAVSQPIFAFNCHPLLKVDEIDGIAEEGMVGPFKPEVARRMAVEARGDGYLVVCVGHPFPLKLQTREAAEAIRKDMLDLGIVTDFVVLVEEENDPVKVVASLNGGQRVRYVDFAEREV